MQYILLEFDICPHSSNQIPTIDEVADDINVMQAQVTRGHIGVLMCFNWLMEGPHRKHGRRNHAGGHECIPLLR
jgi:hypothetical protein